MTAGARRRTAPSFDEAPVESRSRKLPAPRGGGGALPVRADDRTLPVPVASDSRGRSAFRRNVTGAVGLAVIAGVAALAAALATWSIDDPSWSHITDGRVRNVLGAGGAVVADLVMQLIGLTAALFLAPVVIWGWQLTVGRIPRVAKGRWLAWLAGTFVGAAFMGALPPTAGWPLPTGLGGAIGDLVLQIPAAFTGGVLTDTGRLACLILFGPAAAALLVYAAGFPAGAPDEDEEERFEEDEAGGSGLGALAGAVHHNWYSLRLALSRRFGIGHGPQFAYPGEETDDEIGEIDDEPAVEPARRRRGLLGWARSLVEPDDGLDPAPPRDLADGRPEPALVAARAAPAAVRAPVAVEPRHPAFADEPPFADEPAGYDEDDDDGPVPSPRVVAPEPVRPLRGPAARIGGTAPAAVERAPGRVQPPAPPLQPSRRPAATQLSLLDPDGFELPSVDLLTMPRSQPGAARISTDALEQNARLLEGVLEDFGIKGEIINVRPGPVVTLYELEPAPGIKSSRVIGLADDIARSMSAVAARVAVIPGKNAIGIELPNQTREMVLLRELIAAQDFEKSKARLALALGKTIGGEPVIVDLARTPHMLVAGTTGSGKSVSINTMILSLLYRLTPDECRLIMIDPKMLELSVYDGIPHLLSPVVTDPRKAVVALKWTVREMEDRYKKMSKVGVRNIEGYNARVSEAAARGESLSRTVQTGFDARSGEPIFETEEMDLKPLPFIVVLIDEMADLMMVAGKDIEGAVQRLAQMARAAGIHVIMATQRPSVDVITGTIKANFPTRISFQVTSKIDSRTILGEQGAEQLLGQGDMLYMAGGGRIQRVHGPFVSDQEVEAIVAHLKTQGSPDYLDAITAEDDEDGGDGGAAGAPGSWPDGTGEDGSADVYDQAVAVVLRDKRATTSYIQRRLGIGYNRAASLIERMEKEGLVGPPNHAGKREILVEGGEE